MTIKVAINGYGRIGRNVLRAFYEGGKKQDIQIVAINDLGNSESNAHLTRYDTTHGKFPGTVEVDGDFMIVNGDRIRVFAQRNPAEIGWGELDVDVVLECTGFFTTKEKASAHLKGGAKKVIISAPGGKDVDATIVYGVNHDVLKASDTVISNASCTTNCLAPLVKPLNDAIGLENGLMTTVHAYTNDQVLTKGTPRVAIEAGVTAFWYKYVGLEGAVVGIDTFGESAPAPVLFKHFGFTVENVVGKVKSVLTA